jgi:hypothetical protein
MLKALDVNSDVSSEVLASLGGLSDEARSRLDPALNVRALLDSLRHDGRLEDAVRVLTHVLPRQYALAWGCECWQAVHAGIEPDPSDKGALAAALRWLKEPTEENRVAAVELADRLAYRSSAAWLAAAAGWCGGSMLPAGQPEVPPPPTLSSDAVRSAVFLAAAEDAANFEARLAEFVDRALSTFGSGPQ